MLEVDEAGEKLFEQHKKMHNKTPETAGASANDYTNIVPNNEENDEWPDIVTFEEYPVPPIPEFLPSWLDNPAGEFAERAQVPKDAPCMAVLAVLSAALAKKYIVHLPQHDWWERINIYTATIMPPSEKKSETLRVFCAPLHRFEEKEIERARPLHDQQKEERDAKFKRIEQLKAEYAKKGNAEKIQEVRLIRAELDAEEMAYIPQFVSTDCTPEKLVGLMQQNKERMAIITAEGGIFDIMAGRYSSGMMNLDVYLNSWSGDQIRVDRQNRSEYLREPALTFGLFVQPDVISNLPKGMERRGLLGRFLYSVPQSKVGYRKLETSSVDPRLKAHYHENMTWLLEHNVSNQQLHLDQAAYMIFKAFWERVEVAQREGGELTGVIQSWAGKLAGNMLRVAALVHVATYTEQRNIPGAITGDTMQKIVELGEYFIEHAKAAFDCMGVDEDMENAKYLLNVIKRQESDLIPLQNLWQLTKKRMGSAETIHKAVSVLAERGFCKTYKTGKKEFVLVNPNITPNYPNKLHLVRVKGSLGPLGVDFKESKNVSRHAETEESDDVYL